MKNEEQYSKSTAMEKWTTGLCDFFDDPWSCFKTFLCPCITFGQNAEIIDRNATTCCCGGFVFSLLGCWSCLYSFPFRAKLRKQFSLPEEPCGDCLVHCFCLYCAVCQEYRELKNRGLNPSKGWEANAAKMNNRGIMLPPVVAQGMPH